MNDDCHHFHGKCCKSKSQSQVRILNKVVDLSFTDKRDLAEQNRALKFQIHKLEETIKSYEFQVKKISSERDSFQEQLHTAQNMAKSDLNALNQQYTAMENKHIEVNNKVIDHIRAVIVEAF